MDTVPALVTASWPTDTDPLPGASPGGLPPTEGTGAFCCLSTPKCMHALSRENVDITGPEVSNNVQYDTSPQIPNFRRICRITVCAKKSTSRDGFVRLGTTARYDGIIGAEAALLLLEEMKMLPAASGVSPDVFTYTTVISGVARAEVRAKHTGQFGNKRQKRQVWRCVSLLSIFAIRKCCRRHQFGPP